MGAALSLLNQETEIIPSLPEHLYSLRSINFRRHAGTEKFHPQFCRILHIYPFLLRCIQPHTSGQPSQEVLL